MHRTYENHKAAQVVSFLEKGDGRSHQAINRWITEHLRLGTAVAVNQYVSAFRHRRAPDQSLIQRLTEKLKA